MKNGFLNCPKPPILLGLSPVSAEQALEEMEQGISQGAEGFCIQMEEMEPENRNRESYRRIFEAAGGKPIYVTFYRIKNKCAFTEDSLAQSLLELAAFPQVTLCDVMGDLYDPQPGQMTYDPRAVEKQMQLIDQLHAMGKEVLMSAHVFRYRPAEEVLKIALAQQERGADIVKIVTGADGREQQLENLRITQMLKRELKVPFLFLTNGECKLHRRIGPRLGCCMYLCQHNGVVANQPPIADALAFRDLDISQLQSILHSEGYIL